jgi:hypothetical protein
MHMPTASDAPLPPPPRQAHLRRGVRNLRRTYRSLFALIILVLGGWTALDAFRWNDLPDHVRTLDIGFGLGALISLVVWTQMERPLGRELRLGRFGVVTTATLRRVAKPRGRRWIVTITYAFQTAAGVAIQAECRLPRRFPAHRLAPGMTMELLYEPKNPRLNKPRLALGYIEFGEIRKRKGPP